MILLRALAPTFSQFNVPNVLADAALELRDGYGALITTNDNCQETQQAEIQASGFAPPTPMIGHHRRASPGNTTAIVSSKNNTTGNGRPKSISC